MSAPLTSQGWTVRLSPLGTHSVVQCYIPLFENVDVFVLSYAYSLFFFFCFTDTCSLRLHNFVSEVRPLRFVPRHPLVLDLTDVHLVPSRKVDLSLHRRFRVYTPDTS